MKQYFAFQWHITDDCDQRCKHCYIFAEDTGMAPREYRHLLEVCDARFKAYEAAGYDTYFNRKDHLWTLYQYETGAFKIPEDAQPGMIYGGCNCGNCHMIILPTGDVYACRRVQNSRVGNVFEDRLADLWVAERALSGAAVP